MLITYISFVDLNIGVCKVKSLNVCIVVLACPFKLITYMRLLFWLA